MAAVGALVDYERRTPGDRVVTDALLRPGEDAFVALADCLLPERGFFLAADYGAAANTLAFTHAAREGVVVPPSPLSSALSTFRTFPRRSEFQGFRVLEFGMNEQRDFIGL